MKTKFPDPTLVVRVGAGSVAALPSVASVKHLHSIISLEQQVFPCLVDMKWTGVRINTDQVDILEKKLQATYDLCIERVKDATELLAKKL